jgi:hypothetical protein
VRGCESPAFSEHLEGDGEAIFRHACALGLEGIVSKAYPVPTGHKCFHERGGGSDFYGRLQLFRQLTNPEIYEPVLGMCIPLFECHLLPEPHLPYLRLRAFCTAAAKVVARTAIDGDAPLCFELATRMPMI